MKIKFFLTFLIFITSSFAACSGSITGLLPAVSGADGTVIPFEIVLEEGTGTTYVSTEPFIGITTQESINDAVTNAYRMSNQRRGTCDVLISFFTNVNNIDGPSAGAAISTNVYALINDLEVRSDVIITGGITRDGVVTPVGGVYEKSLSGLENGFNTIIVPPISAQEKIVLSELREIYDFRVLEAYNFNDVISIAIYGENGDDDLFTISEEELIEVGKYPFIDSELEKFEPVVQSMLDLEQSALNSLTIPDGFNSLENYYDSSLQNTLYISEQGYLFTAANRAFLNYIEISTISNLENLDLNSKKQQVESCLANLPQVEKTRDNFEWVISSELREYWALNNLESTIITDDMLLEEKYIAYEDLMYADAWCKVSLALREVAKENENGPRIDESVWKDYAQKLLVELEEEIALDPFTTPDRHIITSRLLFDDGKYGASVYDTLFSTDLSNFQTFGLTDEEISRDVLMYSTDKPQSLWGKIYHTQGTYLLSTTGEASSLAVFNYANALDQATKDLEGMIVEVDGPNSSNFNEICGSIFFLMVVFSVFFFRIH